LATSERIQALGVPGADPAGSPVRTSGLHDRRWRQSTVTPPGGTPFTVVLEADSADPVTAALAGGRVLDEGLVAIMLALVKPGDLVLDLGAHVGSFSLAAAAVGCRVVAVEAAASNVDLLRASATRNGFADLHVIHAAVSDAPGTLDFCVRGPWGHVATEGVDLPSVPVAAVTVDELLAELGMGRPAFVKIDVEGSEIPAIRGMAGLLGGPDAPYVLYESNGHTLGLFDSTPTELGAQFHALGYTSLAVEADRLVRVVPGEMQPQTIVECLAVKRDVVLPGWPTVPALGLHERVGRAIADARHPNPDHRAYIAGALASADGEVLSHPAVVEALDLLLADSDEAVRVAASWWSHSPVNRSASLLLHGGEPCR
jgi:FkbM family methyltransferase